MGDLIGLGTNGNFDAEFLAQLANETAFEGFPGLDFAPRKFPKPAQVIARTPLGDKELALVKNEACGDVDDLAHRDQRPMLL